MARSALAALVVASLCNFPSMASSEKSLGFVAQAEHARLDNIAVAVGANVFAGDAFDTGANGTLRLRFGSSQLYLLPMSAAKIARSSDGALVAVVRGTAGFSSPASSQLALETPGGILRAAAGKPAHGQVTMRGENEFIVSAFRGDLVLDNDGELHSIPEGKSYRVVVEQEKDTVSANNPDFVPAQNHHRKRRIIFALILTGAVGFATYQIYQELSESPSKISY